MAQTHIIISKAEAKTLITMIETFTTPALLVDEERALYLRLSALVPATVEPEIEVVKRKPRKKK